jgi:hypothetical protein
MRETLQTHEYDNGDRVDVIKMSRSYLTLVFNGPNGFETVIKFDAVVTTEKRITFYRNGTEVGSIEGKPDHHGELGAFLQSTGEIEKMNQ